MTLNFNDYQIVLQARQSKKFKELDDQVRAMSIELGKGNTNIDRAEYQRLLALRDQTLRDFQQAMQPASTFDLTIYQRLPKNLTTKIDTFIAKFPRTKLKNIVFQGPTGTGKTYCAQYIADALTRKGFTVCLANTYTLVKRMNDHMYGQDNSAPADFFDSDLLIIDDLGAEPTIKNSDEYLYTVVNERYANQKAFIITTNLSNEQILTRYDQRFFGRIFDQSRTAVLIFNGKDLRIE